MGKYKHGFGSRDYLGIKRRFYDRWQYMITRCFNENRIDWKNYGGRGITVSEEWRDFKKFKRDMYDAFIKHLAKHGLKNTTLDRMDVQKEYSKGNCRWATKVVQSRNRRGTMVAKYNGESQPLWRIVELTGRTYQTISSRVKRGIPLDAPYRKSRLSISADQ